MKKQNITKLLVLSLAALVFLPACGGNSSSSSSSQQQQSTTSSQQEQQSTSSSQQQTSSSSSSSSSSQQQGTNYGSQANPLSITEIRALTAMLQESDYDNSYNSSNVAYVTGVVQSISGKNTVLTDSSNETFTIYNGSLASGVSSPVVGDTVVASGYYCNFKGTYEFTFANSTAPLVLSCTHNTYSISSSVVDDQNQPSQKATVSVVDSALSGSTVTVTVTVDSGYKISSVKVNNESISESNGTYSFTATSTNNIVVTVVSENAAVASVVLLKANVSSNTNAAASNLVSNLNLDSTVFSVSYTRGGTSNDMAIRTDGIRMYANKGEVGNSIVVSLNDTSKNIKSITITYSGNDYVGTSVVKAGSTAVTAQGTGLVRSYEINASSFTLTNDNSTGSAAKQVRFDSIQIEYFA